MEFVAHASPSCNNRRFNRNESCLDEYSLRCGIVVARRRSERSQRVLRAGDLKQLPQSRRGHSTTRNPLTNAISNVRGSIDEIVQIESTRDSLVVADEHVKGTDPGLLLGQELKMPLIEVLEEVVASIADRFGEVCPIL